MPFSAALPLPDISIQASGLTLNPLTVTNQERGMRAYGLTQLGYRRQLQQWLDLSINKEVPISLLILSRAFTLDSKVRPSVRPRSLHMRPFNEYPPIHTSLHPSANTTTTVHGPRRRRGRLHLLPGQGRCVQPYETVFNTDGVCV